jgi:formate hydrogenlyase transcriptional activator
MPPRSDELPGPQRSEAQFRRFLEMIPALAWRSFPDGAREFHTRQWHEFTGLSAEESRGWGWTKVVHPDDLDRLMREWSAIKSSGQGGTLESRVRRFDGTYRWFMIRVEPFYNDAGEIESWYGCNTDIDDRKNVEEQLRQGEHQLSTVVDAIEELICVIAPDESLMYVNQYMRAYTGFGTREVLEGVFRQKVFHPDELEAMAQGRRDGIRQGVSFALEHRVRRHDGEYRWFRITYSPLRDIQNRIVRWYTTGMDIHEARLTSTRLQNENLALREDLTRESMFEEIVGSSVAMQKVLAHVSRVAPLDSTVLILGETGTGKELIARAVHARSSRSSKAFIRVNCAAIPPSLIASELFGHEKGAFTGALQKRMGRFEAADGGTLFLDEVGDLPAETQVALLRVLQEREFERVGSNHSIAVDVRVVAATNRNLLERVSQGSFRQDLFYRLNVFPIQLPSLRERPGDIPLLLQYFIDRYARKAGKHFSSVSDQTLKLFTSYEWPGNIRELQNVIERGVVLCDGNVFAIDESWLKSRGTQMSSPVALEAAVAEREATLIKTALAESGGRISKAATKLQIPRQTLASKMKSLGIERR